MIITKTPFRISFVEGGSDLADFYKRHETTMTKSLTHKGMISLGIPSDH